MNTIADALEAVRKWMQQYQQETPTKPTIPKGKTRSLRYRLNREEITELRHATTPEEALDAIADTLYVVLGSAVAYGFSGEQVEKAFAEVHRSNLTKFWRLEQVAEADIESMTAKIVGRDEGGALLVVTDETGKVIKSPSYSPADIAGILS